MKLTNRSTQSVIVDDLLVAKTFATRSRGLLGRSGLNPNEAIWIVPCNAIHTWFMKFPIDCVFVDKDLKVVSVKREIKPWRLLGPILKAHSVIEFAASVTAGKVSVGDHLHVDA